MKQCSWYAVGTQSKQVDVEGGFVLDASISYCDSAAFTYWPRKVFASLWINKKESREVFQFIS